MAIYGGVSYSKQIRRLDRGVDIVVACPGRLLDLIDRENVFLDEVEIVILTRQIEWQTWGSQSQFVKF